MQALEVPVALAYAKVVGGQNVGALQRVNEEHFNGPATDSAQDRQALDERLVRHVQRLAAVRYDAVDGGLSNATDRGELGSREAADAVQFRVGGKQLPGRREGCVGIKRQQSLENGVTGFRVQLLVAMARTRAS